MGLFAEAVQIAGSVELHERLTPASGSDLTARDQGVAADRPTVGSPSGQLTLIEDRPRSGYDARTPLGVAGSILPAVDGRGGQAGALEGHVEKGEALVPSGHGSTIAGCASETCGPIVRYGRQADAR